ncbi:hypothetical protein GCM10025734_83520 [Kitasatospora paranensis]
MVDQPVEDGGQDADPTPTDLFAASLASAWPSTPAAIWPGTASIRKGCGWTPASRWRRTAPPGSPRCLVAKVPEGLDAARQDALLAVASHCAVHNTLRQTPTVRVEAARPGETEWPTALHCSNTHGGINERRAAMATVELTDKNFDEIAGGKGIVLVDFWAAWCGPCRMFAPVFERVSQKHPDIVFGKVDTQAQQQLAAAFQISSIPTLMAVRDGVVLYAQPGALPEAALEDVIRQIRAVDMDDVRQRIAASAV